MALKDKAIDIHGKKYVLVSDRILEFNDKYKNGSIQTELVSWKENTIVVKALVMPNVETPLRIFTGYSQEVVGQGNINKTSALENGETSAVGRALAMMGIGVIDSIASVDEITKANNHSNDTYDTRKGTAPKSQEYKKEYPTRTGKTEHGECKDCEADMVKSPKTGKVFCSEKCWTKPKQDNHGEMDMVDSF